MPSAVPVPGVNDLQSQFPQIAAQAYGWDPSAVAARSGKKKVWRCPLGHIWESSVSHRTVNKSGCPYCSNNKVLPGFNDLRTRFPGIAEEALGWNPSDVIAGSNQKLNWRCKMGHTWAAKVNHRTSSESGCPICSNNALLVGFNDLKTKFPAIASEAHGWDPTTVIAGTAQKRKWRCKLNHIWDASVNQRTSRGRGCPVCAGQKLLVGFNDLKTRFPEIAAEAYGWDPTTVFAATTEKREWKCALGHRWNASIGSRTVNGNGCPVCAGQKLLVGFNDLKTRFPEIAAEAYGWDPTTVIAGTDKTRRWRCVQLHTWSATINNRTSQGTGCPICADSGFNPGKDAWFYLMQRPGEQQLGITNNIVQRIKQHEKHGWTLLEHTEPSPGRMVQKTEALLKKWLKKEIGLIKGTTENWSTTSMEVQTLAELKARSGIVTELF